MPIEFSVEDGIATIVFNLPDRLNAFDPAHYVALSKALIIVREDPSIRVALVTGAGERSFSVGTDNQSPKPPLEYVEAQTSAHNDGSSAFGATVWKPIVAAVNGYCLGDGMCLLLATDIRIAAEHATFGLPDISRTKFATRTVIKDLLQQLPYAIAMELLLFNEPIGALTASKWGLVNKVVPHADLLSTAYTYARRMSTGAPSVMRAAEEVALHGRDFHFGRELRFEETVRALLRGALDRNEGSDTAEAPRLQLSTAT
jgi:(E)-benzylidenesuccinyl-CoA hydratase